MTLPVAEAGDRRTDAAGRFRLREVPAGKVKVVLVPPPSLDELGWPEITREVAPGGSTI